MAFTANKVPSDPAVTHQTILCRSHKKHTFFTSTMNNRNYRIQLPRHGMEQDQLSHRCLLAERSTLLNEGLWCIYGKLFSFISKKSSFLRKSSEANNTQEKECVTTYGDVADFNSGITRLENRARQDVAFLETEFLKLDARAREYTEKIDRNVKKKAKHIHRIATVLKDKAHSRLKIAADKHWSDAALEANLCLADFCVKQRAMEDALMALEEAYWSMASALSEADGIDYTDPEELELLITTLIDLDAMGGKQSVSLLAECSSSPDVSTRRALANALANAPPCGLLEMQAWELYRLAKDSSAAVAAAASKAIYELKKQWEIEEGDSWRFMMDENTTEEKESRESDSEEVTK